MGSSNSLAERDNSPKALDNEFIIKVFRRKSVDHQIVSLSKVPAAAVEAVMSLPGILIEANDTLLDDYVDEILDQDRSLDQKAALTANEKLLKGVITKKTLSSSASIREMAKTLMRLADCIDQNWSPNKHPMQFERRSLASKYERNSLELAKRARIADSRAIIREKYLPADLLGEPAWNMLLELFQQFAGGARVSSKSLTLASRSPQTTALRYLVRLEELGLIQKSISVSDGRVTLVSLTEQGVVAVGSILEEMQY
ncbi:MAG: hypothetical protein AAF697_03775 [Pseudomonadota bacterium]